MRMHPSFVLPVEAGESAKSNVSRTAFRIGRTLKGLLRDLGIDVNRFVGGDPGAIRAMALALGHPADVFDGRTFRRVEKSRFGLGPQTFSNEALRRTTLQVCPVCLDEDASGPLGKAGRYARWYWELTQYRCCTTHRCLLVPIGRTGGAELNHHVAWHLNAIDHAGLQVEPVASTELSAYLVDRLSGAIGPSWLSAIPLHAAAKTSEMVGIVMTRGAKANWRDVTPAEWVEAGNAGFRQLSLGREGLMAFFEQHRAANSGEFGALKLYGSFFDYVSRTTDQGYTPIVDAFREHILANTVVAPGKRVLGQVVAKRKYHTVTSAAVEYGFHRVTLRRHLVDIGILKGDAVAVQDRYLFDAEEHAPLIAQLAEAMPRKAAQRYLGLSSALAGLIPTFVAPVSHGKHGRLEHLFTRTALDDFVSRMVSSASPMTDNDKGLVSIGVAAIRSQRTVVDVARLLIEGRLKTVRVAPHDSQIRSLMVDPFEVRALLIPRSNLLTLPQVKARLGCCREVVKGLVDARIIPTRSERHPLAHKTIPFVSEDDLDAFRATFIATPELAQQVGHHHNRLRYLLRKRGIKPDLEKSQVGMDFYRRSKVGSILASL